MPRLDSAFSAADVIMPEIQSAVSCSLCRWGEALQHASIHLQTGYGRLVRKSEQLAQLAILYMSSSSRSKQIHPPSPQILNQKRHKRRKPTEKFQDQGSQICTFFMSSSSLLTPRPLPGISAGGSPCPRPVPASWRSSRVPRIRFFGHRWLSRGRCIDQFLLLRRYLHWGWSIDQLVWLCRVPGIGRRRGEVFDNVLARSNRDGRIDLFVDTSQRAAHLVSGTGIRATREAVWRSSSFVIRRGWTAVWRISRRLSIDSGVEPQRSLRLPLRASPSVLLA
jgi:hypothetical protein